MHQDEICSSPYSPVSRRYFSERQRASVKAAGDFFIRNKLHADEPGQVDGALGVAAAISEMLVQSHEGYIHLLPALPVEWASGSFTGVRARGGFELDLSWEDGTVSSLEVLSKAGAVCRIRVVEPAMVLAWGKEVASALRDGVLAFETEVGGWYRVVEMNNE